ncbi:PepSY domain-containing protein [Poseidonocella sedimentorum]|uniref:Peptidase propeptide and YPEB domain-containing protein n=1 Tax=Poseidonocella sedimentorum TaxID=871652 RepID=A0A1I6D3Z2_9RHOB|nr:PepSY domain-containing protein [Poseidonocella sedimentorum]SFR00037.1 Peptidase propeptide and YPEB domain-containing protein [Poseidonocella sedimentorum]
MKRLLTTAAACGIAASAAFAAHHEVSEEKVEMIMAKLTEMKCQMDADDIEVTDEGGYDLDDVICEGGNQFDIELDAEMNEVSRRAE